MFLRPSPFSSIGYYFHHGSWEVWHGYGNAKILASSCPKPNLPYTSGVIVCFSSSVPHPSWGSMVWYGMVWMRFLAPSIPFGRAHVTNPYSSVSHSSLTTQLRERGCYEVNFFGLWLPLAKPTLCVFYRAGVITINMIFSV